MHQRVHVKQILFIIFLLIIVCLNQNCNHDEDSRANGLRIISLSPFITEIIYALAAEKDLVAVTDYCIFPEEAKN
jgi:ABC-type hemin transport system substrate-binding protein